MPDIAVMPCMMEMVTTVGPRYLTMMAGRGAGKTHGIGCRIKYLTSSYPGFKYVYLGPSTKHGKDVFNELRCDYDYRKFIRSANARDPYPIIKLKNESEVVFRSVARGDILTGGNEHEFCLDESQHRIYTEDLVDAILNPALRVDSPVGNKGTLLMCGQFRGDDWRKKRFWNYGVSTLDDGEPNPMYMPNEYRSWRAPASAGWTYQVAGGPERYEQERQRHIRDGKQSFWDQEFDCLPCSNQYAAFPPDSIDDCSIRMPYRLCRSNEERTKNEVETEPRPGMGYAVVVDPGEVIDPCGVLVGDARGNIVAERVYPRGQRMELSARNAALLARKFNNATLVCMANEFRAPGEKGEAYVTKFREAAREFGLTFKDLYEGGGLKKRMIRYLLFGFQDKTVAIAPGCTQLLAQLKAYEYSVSKRPGSEKRMTYSAPDGQHDDLCSAAMGYFEFAVTHKWVFFDDGSRYRGAS